MADITCLLTSKWILLGVQVKEAPSQTGVLMSGRSTFKILGRDQLAKMYRYFFPLLHIAAYLVLLLLTQQSTIDKDAKNLKAEFH